MTDPFSLHRFVTAQDGIFDAALAQLRAGAKTSHWMWFIFPQLAALGRSTTAKYYGMSSVEQARAYLEHSLLGPRLRDCIEAILPWAGKRTSEDILGTIDAMKLQSSLTLFDCACPDDLFARALDAFYSGQRDDRTLGLLGTF